MAQTVDVITTIQNLYLRGTFRYIPDNQYLSMFLCNTALIHWCKISSGHPQLVGLRLTPHLKLMCCHACRRVSTNVCPKCFHQYWRVFVNVFTIRFRFWQWVYGVIPQALERLWQEVCNVKHAASMPLPAAAAGSGFSNLTLSSFVTESKTAAAKSPVTVSWCDHAPVPHWLSAEGNWKSTELTGFLSVTETIKYDMLSNCQWHELTSKFPNLKPNEKFIVMTWKTAGKLPSSQNNWAQRLQQRQSWSSPTLLSSQPPRPSAMPSASGLTYPRQSFWFAI